MELYLLFYYYPLKDYSRIIKRGRASKIISLKLFSRYSSFFDEFIINEFGRKQKADTSHKGHKALMAKIKAHVENNLIRLEKIR